MNDAIQLAWFILRRCAENRTPISHLQLQKILYFLQRLNLDKTNEPLFTNRIFAWTFGPVVRDVYYEFSIFSSLRIIPSEVDPNPTIDLADFLLEEIDRRAEQRPWSMVDETHQAGRAWDLVFKNGEGNGREIPLELIRERG